MGDPTEAGGSCRSGVMRVRRASCAREDRARQTPCSGGPYRTNPSEILPDSSRAEMCYKKRSIKGQMGTKEMSLFDRVHEGNSLSEKVTCHRTPEGKGGASPVEAWGRGISRKKGQKTRRL